MGGPGSVLILIFVLLLLIVMLPLLIIAAILFVLFYLFSMPFRKLGKVRADNSNKPEKEEREPIDVEYRIE